MSSKISALTLSALAEGDSLVIARGGANYKVNSSEMMSRVFRPENYGAVRDGSTNDTAAINAAINACYTAGGGIVLFSPGNYRANETSGLAILTKTGVLLKGSGMNATTISTDNSLAASNYCLIAPFDYNTASQVPFSGHEIHVEDMTLTATSYTNATAQNRLHNLIGFVNCPAGSARRVGFGISRAHYAEMNSSQNILIQDCATVGNGDCAGPKFQLDPGGASGQGVARQITATLTGVATYASGTQTLITVASTTGMKEGDFLTISGANGTSAASYNIGGCHKITKVVSATTFAIALAFPVNTPTATTTGAITVRTPVKNVLISRYRDKAGLDTTRDGGRYFMELSHSGHTGSYYNIEISDCVIVPNTSSVSLTQDQVIIGFDNAALPTEFIGLRILRNQFVDGGHTGATYLIALHQLDYNSAHPFRRMEKVVIKDNIVRNCGIIAFLTAGDIGTYFTGRCRTSIAATDCQIWRDITVEGNVIEPILRGKANTAGGATRLVLLGAMEKAVVKSNRVRIQDIAPSNLYGQAWTSSTGGYAFCFDHVRDLHVEDNEVEVELTEGNAALYLTAYIFGCQAFELAGAGPLRGSQVWINNSAVGRGAIANGLMKGFTEQANASAWASYTSPSIAGIWKGNRVSSSGTLTVETCGGASYLNIGVVDGVPTTTATTAAESESGSPPTKQRHRWGYGPRSGSGTLVAGALNVSDNLVTNYTIVNLTRRITGGTLGELTYNLVPASGFTVNSANALDTSSFVYTIHEPH